MRKIALTLPYPPSVNHLFATVKQRNGKPLRIKSERAKKYANCVLGICFENRIKPLDGDIKVTLLAYRPQKIGDLDNLPKAVFDALKGSAFHDDKQIVEIHAFRFDDKKNPRVEVEIEAV